MRYPEVPPPVAPPSYPVAPGGVFWSLQGEGHLRGFQMAFVRLAGCDVGCPGCDTDYSVSDRVDLPELLHQVDRVVPKDDRDQWVWVTGGEPTVHRLAPLLAALKARGYSTALASSGVRRVIPPVDWLSVSPHSAEPESFMQRYGQELKLVDGLNGLDLETWAGEWDKRVDFMYRYVQPSSVKAPDGRWVEDPDSLARCLTFLRGRPRWSLSRQDHHAWGVA